MASRRDEQEPPGSLVLNGTVLEHAGRHSRRVLATGVLGGFWERGQLLIAVCGPASGNWAAARAIAPDGTLSSAGRYSLAEILPGRSSIAWFTTDPTQLLVTRQGALETQPAFRYQLPGKPPKLIWCDDGSSLAVVGIEAVSIWRPESGLKHLAQWHCSTSRPAVRSHTKWSRNGLGLLHYELREGPGGVCAEVVYVQTGRSVVLRGDLDDMDIAEWHAEDTQIAVGFVSVGDAGVQYTTTLFDALTGKRLTSGEALSE